MKTLTRILCLFLTAFWPLLLQAQTTESYTFTTNLVVPSGDLSGLSDVEEVSSAIGAISSLQVHLKISGEFNGDLYCYLRNTNGFVVLLNRPGSVGTNPYGYADSGLDVTFADNSLNGDIHLYQNVTTPVTGSPLTGIWQADGRTNDPLTVTDLSPRTTALTNFNGGGGSGQWTLYIADLVSGATNEVTEWGLDISGVAIPTLSWTNPAAITYGTPLNGAQFNAAATHDTTNVPGTFVYSFPSGTVLKAGSNQTLSVTFTPNDANSFLPVTTNVAINVSAAPLIITANSTNKLYGAALPAFAASYSGFVNGDTSSSLAAPPTLLTSASAGSAIGSYPITASGAADTNYLISYNSGTLTVSAAPLIITANSTNKLYGAALPAFTASYSGFVNGDTSSSLTAPPILLTSASAGSPIGSYPITASGAADTNYLISYNSGTLTVSAAPLIITANNTNKVFGQTLTFDGSEFTTSGLTGSDTVTSATLTSLGATPTATAGIYAITPSLATGSGLTNYVISYLNGVLTVQQALTAGNVASSGNPAPSGTNVIFTFTVSATGSGSGTPTGTANFRVDGDILGSGALTGGVAAFNTNNLTRGLHTIVAEYAGDTNFIGTTNSLMPVELIDTPPTAGAVTIYRNPALSVHIQLSTLLTNASDAYGDSLTLNVSPSSENGGTITLISGWVFYTPPTGFTNVDTFTYSVTDTLGQKTTGLVTVAILTNNGPSQNLFITQLGSGGVLVSGSGIPGYSYGLQYSVTANPYSWQLLTNLTADSTGKFSFADQSGDTTRFYRTVYP
jgi:subtilisin-like proprotein convertase family protein